MNVDAFVSAGTKGSGDLGFSVGTLTAKIVGRTATFSTSYIGESRMLILPPMLTT